MYQQNYDPLGNVFLSTLVAAVPILTLLYFIALHPHRDAQGNGTSASPRPTRRSSASSRRSCVSCLAFQHAGRLGGLGVRARHAVGISRHHLDRRRRRCSCTR